MAIRKQRTELFVGLFVFIGLAIMGILIVQFGRFSDRIKEKYPITVSFPDASGIREGIPVRLGGAKVGSVAKDPTHAADYLSMTIRLDIFSEFKIPEGSSFRISSVGMMGDKFISIEMPSKPTDKYIAPGSRVKGYAPGGLGELQEDAAEITDEIKQVLEELLVTVKDVRVAVKRLDEFFVKANEGILADENIENLKTSFAELKTSAENIRIASEKIDPLVVDATEVVAKAGNTFDTATETIAKAGPGLEKLEPTVEELQSVLRNANGTIDKIESGDGPLATLIGDTELRKDLQDFVDKLDRYGILGYPKDKSLPKDQARSERPSASDAPTRVEAIPAEEKKKPGGLGSLFKRKR